MCALYIIQMGFFSGMKKNGIWAGIKKGLTHGGAGVKAAANVYIKPRSKVPIPPVPGTGMLMADMGAGGAWVAGTAASALGDAM